MTERIALPEGVPPLTQYYVYMTAGCNLACQHCWLSPVYQPKGTTGGHLDYELFKLAIEEGIPLGLQGVKLTGGEPLLHPEFLRFVDLLKEKNLGLTIETNATLMTPEIARHLKEKSTLSHISVSIDGANANSHDSFRGVPGAFEKAVAGIKMLVEVGYHPQVIMSLHSRNVDEIEELVHLAESWGAGSVKFNLIQPTGRGETMTDRGQVLDITRLVELGKWVEHDLQKRVGIPLFYSWPMAFYSLNRLLSMVGSSCNLNSIMGIISTGQYALCGIGVQIPELCFGSLGINNLNEIWINNSTLLNLRSIIPSEMQGICQKCLHKSICKGSCVAQNYLKSGQLNSAFWFCNEVDGIGKFPISRYLDNKHTK